MMRLYDAVMRTLVFSRPGLDETPWYKRSCNRSDYWLSVLTLLTLSLLIFLPKYLWYDHICDELFTVQFVIDGVLAFFILCLLICLSIQRLNDVGIPINWVCILYSVAIVGVWICSIYDNTVLHYVIGASVNIITLGLCCLDGKKQKAHTGTVPL